MYRHGPTVLTGPVSKARVMWIWSDSGASETAELTLEPQDAAPPLSSHAGLRMDLVQRVRREIAAGLYDTSDKFEMALDNLFDRLEQAD